MEPKTASIYCITNKINNKQYIGFTTNIHKRILYHLSLKSRCPYLSNAIKKYGRKNFKITVVYQSIDINHTLNVMETYFIKKYNTIYPNGYNLTFGGEGSLGRMYSNPEKTKIKMSKATKARWKVSEDKKKQLIYNMKKNNKYLYSPKPAHVRQKMSESRRLWWNSLTEQDKKEYSSKLKKFHKNHPGFCYQKDKRYKQACKPVVFNGMQFESIRHAAEVTGHYRSYIKKHGTIVENKNE